MNIEFIREPKDPPCKGRFFRCSLSLYLGSKGEYVYQEKMIPLKRMSCSGCKDCGWVDDTLDNLDIEYNLPIIDHAEHGALYMLDVANVHTDWETGIVDDWDTVFVKVKEVETLTEEPTG